MSDSALRVSSGLILHATIAREHLDRPGSAARHECRMEAPTCVGSVPQSTPSASASPSAWCWSSPRRCGSWPRTRSRQRNRWPTSRWRQWWKRWPRQQSRTHRSSPRRPSNSRNRWRPPLRPRARWRFRSPAPMVLPSPAPLRCVTLWVTGHVVRCDPGWCHHGTSGHQPLHGCGRGRHRRFAGCVRRRK